jgi:hypothetical protein
MATKTTEKKPAKKIVKANLPEGFEPARAKLDGFFAREPGNTVIGRLRGAFAVKGKFGEKNVFRIELTTGQTQVGDGEIVEPGGTIGIDETGYTKVLGEIESGTLVYVRYDGKAGTGEKDAHLFTIGKASGN